MSFFLAAATSDAESAGRAVGAFVWVAVILVGLAKCVEIMRRPRANTICLLSLLLCLLGWLAAMALGASDKFVENTRLVAVLASIVIIGCSIAALVLAIVGLVDYSKNRGSYDQGRRQAVTSLILSVSACGLYGYGIVSGIRDRDRVPFDTGRPVEPYVSEEFNFRIEPPDSSWSRLDTQALNPDADFGMMKLKPLRVHFIIAEHGGSELSTPMMVEIAKGALRSGGRNTSFTDLGAEAVDGMEGTRFTTRVEIQGKPLAYSHWIANHQGFVYQLITYGPGTDTEDVLQTAREIEKGFSLIDRDRVADPALGAEAADYRDPAFGVAVEGLAEAGWSEWDTLEEDLPEATFGALNGNFSGFALIPFHARVSLPEPGINALARGLLAQFGITYDDLSPTEVKEVEQGMGKGIQISFGRVIDGDDYVYIVRVLRAGRACCLAAGWWVKSSGDRSDLILAALDKVEIAPVEEGDERPADGLNLAQKKGQAVIANQIGLAGYEADQDLLAQAYFEEAFALDPQKPIFLDNILEVRKNLGDLAGALEVIEREIGRFPAHLALAAEHANLLGQNGKPEAAAEVYGKVFAEGFTDDAHLLTYLNLMVDLEEYETAIAATEAFLQRRPSAKVKRWRASLFSRKGDHDMAVEQLKGLLRANPGSYDADAAYELADILLDADRAAEALEVVGELAREGHDSAAASVLRGRAQLQLDQLPQAKDSFEEALRRDPGDEMASQYLERVSASLGVGSHAGAKQPIPPVEIPPEVEAALGRLKPWDEAGGGSGHSALNLKYITGVDFKPGPEGHYRKTYYRSVKVMDTAGIERYSTLYFGFDPAYERIYVNALEVRDGEGKLLAEAERGKFFVTDDTSSGQATQDKLLHLPVPKLEAGRVIDFTVTTERLSPPEETPFEVFLFGSGSPTAHEVVFYRGVLDGIATESSNLPSSQGEGGVRYWVVDDPPLFANEPDEVDASRHLPMLWVGQDGKSWSEVAASYLAEIEELTAPDEAAAALAKTLLAGLGEDAGDPEKAAAIFRHIQDSYTYKAIEFGVRARIPYAAGKTIENRYGDCKDLSLLMHQLLGAAGLRSRLALVNTDGVTRDGLPDLDQFDHMVVQVGAGDSRRFVDPTSKWGDWTAPVPDGLAEKRALVLDPAGGQLVTIPPYPDGANAIQVDRRIKVAAAQDLEVAETLVFQGYIAGWVRSFLGGVAENDRRDALQRALSAEKVRVTGLETKGLQAGGGELVLEVIYTVPNAFQDDGKRRLLTLPAPFERYFLEPVVLEGRKSPFEVAYPLTVKARTEVTAGGGQTLTPPEDFAGEGDDGFVRWRCQVAGGDGEGAEVVLRAEFERKTGRHPPERYDAFLRSIATALDHATQPVAVTVDGAGARDE